MRSKKLLLSAGAAFAATVICAIIYLLYKLDGIYEVGYPGQAASIAADDRIQNIFIELQSSGYFDEYNVDYRGDVYLSCSGSWSYSGGILAIKYNAKSTQWTVLYKRYGIFGRWELADGLNRPMKKDIIRFRPPN